MTVCRAVGRTLIGGRGCIFIYSGSAQLASFEINFISKETSRAEPEYMNIHRPSPPINAIATALTVCVISVHVCNFYAFSTYTTYKEKRCPSRTHI